MAPLSRPVHLLGMGLFAIGYGVVRAILLFGVVAAFFGLHLPDANYVAALVLLIIASISFIGIGMMTAVLPLISPEKGTQLGFVAQGLLLVVSGVYYPVSVLPQWMQWLSVISPATYALRGCRAAIIDGAGLSDLCDRDLGAAPDRRGLGAARALDLPHRRALREEAREAEAVGMSGRDGSRATSPERCARICSAVERGDPAVERARRCRTGCSWIAERRRRVRDHSSVGSAARTDRAARLARAAAAQGSARAGRRVRRPGGARARSRSALGLRARASTRIARVRLHAWLRGVGRNVELTRRLAPGERASRTGSSQLGDEHRVGAYAVLRRRRAGHADRRSGRGALLRGLAGAELARCGRRLRRARARTVVGYATLQPTGRRRRGSSTASPACCRERRRRGFATALGRAQIAWAAERGYEELVTTTRRLERRLCGGRRRRSATSSATGRSSCGAPL